MQMYYFFWFYAIWMPLRRLTALRNELMTFRSVRAQCYWDCFTPLTSSPPHPQHLSLDYFVILWTTVENKKSVYMKITFGAIWTLILLTITSKIKGFQFERQTGLLCLHYHTYDLCARPHTLMLARTRVQTYKHTRSYTRTHTLRRNINILCII